MPVQALLPSPVPDALVTALDAQGEQEYIQLLSMLQHTQGIFALMLVRSNFTPALREVLFQRLAHDLAPVPLILVQCTRTKYNAAGMLAEAAKLLPASGVLALTGLEDTPDMVMEGGKEMKRPPALATLNHGREALRRACKMPIIVWCDEWVYQTLREYAPDFFDHFTGLFNFNDVAPQKQVSSPLNGRDVGATQNLTGVGIGSTLIMGTGTLAQEVAFTQNMTGEGTMQITFPLSGHFDVSYELPNVPASISPTSRVAVKFYQQELDAHPAPTLERAHLLLGLVQSLIQVSAENNAFYLEQAEAAVQEAKSILATRSDDYEWGRAQQLEGLIYLNLPAGDREENIRHAIGCFTAALSIYSETQHPVEWAYTQMSLGSAYLEFPLEGSTSDWIDKSGHSKAWEKFEKWRTHKQFAVTCFENSLRVFTLKEYPEMWATIQRLLGEAKFGREGKTQADEKEHLKRVVAHYEAALSVFTEDKYPHDWARTQSLLGFAYYRLGEYDRRYLRKSVVCYEAALRVYNRADTPEVWAVTQRMLGLALSAQDKWHQARQAWLSAKEVFQALDMKAEVERIDLHFEVADKIEDLAKNRSSRNRGKSHEVTQLEHTS